MSGRPSGRVMQFIGVANIVGVFACLTFLLFLPVPTENRELVSMMLGNIVGYSGAIVSFYYGSSSESASKNEIIRTQADTQASLANVAAAATTPAITIPAGETVTVAAGESDEQAP